MNRLSANLLRRGLDLMVRMVYPRVVVTGIEQLPDGAAIYVANHPNGLIDGLVLPAALGRQLRFIAKGTFFANPLLGPLLQAVGALPVYRSHDTVVRGAARRNANAATFAAVNAALAADQAIALFPEGTVNSGSELLPLRSGAARIALAAGSASAAERLIVPVAIWYSRKLHLRSAVTVCVGPPFSAADLAPLHATDSRRAVQLLTERIAVKLAPLLAQARSIAATPAAPAAPRAWQCALLVAGSPVAALGLITTVVPYLLLRPLLPRLIRRNYGVTITGKLVFVAASSALSWLSVAGLVTLRHDRRAGLATLLVLPGAGYVAVIWYEIARKSFCYRYHKPVQM